MNFNQFSSLCEFFIERFYAGLVRSAETSSNWNVQVKLQVMAFSGYIEYSKLPVIATNRKCQVRETASNLSPLEMSSSRNVE